MTLEQDIEFLKMMTFDNINEMNNNAIIQKYFDIKTDGKGAIEHIFKGFIDSMNYLDGYHTECLYPGLYNTSSQLNIDKTKPYILIPDANKIGDCSCFPITMSSSDVLVAILKAYKQCDRKENSKYDVYLPEYGFTIHLQLSYTGKIYTAYPKD